MWNRAAQFAPFAALTGFGAAIKDTAKQNEDSYEAKNNGEAEDYKNVTVSSIGLRLL